MKLFSVPFSLFPVMSCYVFSSPIFPGEMPCNDGIPESALDLFAVFCRILKRFTRLRDKYATASLRASSVECLRNMSRVGRPGSIGFPFSAVDSMRNASSGLCKFVSDEMLCRNWHRGAFSRQLDVLAGSDSVSD
jgi:hypothetical protein